MAKILIVEDNEMNRDMLSRRLIKKGYEVSIAVDGQEYDTLHLSFENVGITPDDQFWVSINKTTRLMDKWRFKLGGGAEGEFWWREWEEHGGLKIATIRARMDQQLGALNEVIDHYRSAGVLRTVNGLRGIGEVAEEIDTVLAEAGIGGAGSVAETTAG